MKAKVKDVRDSFPLAKSALEAIHLKCRDCTCDQQEQIDNCTVKKCPLYPFRANVRVVHSRNVSDAERAKRSERMKDMLARKAALKAQAMP